MNFARVFRKRILVVRAAQYSYALGLAIFAVVLSSGTAVASIFAFYAPAWVVCPDGSDGCIGIVLAPTGFPALAFSLGALLIPASLLAFFLGLVLSNRTFGPFNRIKDFVYALKAGDYSARLRLREKDHLFELAETFNDLAETLEKKNQKH